MVKKLTKRQKLINKRDRHKKTKGYSKKMTRVQLKKDDNMWAFKIREDPCLVCDTNETLNAHHIIPREEMSLRHNTLNGCSLCQYHHKFCVKFSPHRNAVIFLLILKQKYPNKYNFVMDQALILQLKYNKIGDGNLRKDS